MKEAYFEGLAVSRAYFCFQKSIPICL